MDKDSCYINEVFITIPKPTPDYTPVQRLIPYVKTSKEGLEKHCEISGFIMDPITRQPLEKFVSAPELARFIRDGSGTLSC